MHTQMEVMTILVVKHKCNVVQHIICWWLFSQYWHLHITLCKCTCTYTHHPNTHTQF